MTEVSTGFFHIEDIHIELIELKYYAGALSYIVDDGFMIYLGTHLTEEERTTVTLELVQRFCHAQSLGWLDKDFRLYALSPAPYDQKRNYFFGGSRNHARKPARIIG